MLKSAMHEELLDAVQDVLSGRIYVSPDLSTGLERFQQPVSARRSTRSN